MQIEQDKMRTLILNEYSQNPISFNYFNICLLAYNCVKNEEYNNICCFKFSTPPEEHTVVLNDNLKDVLRRVNNSLIYLGYAVNGLTNYYELYSHTPNEQKAIYENLFRQMCRQAYVELFVYFEKVKSLIRYYFNFDFKKTKYDKDFYKRLNEVSNLDKRIEKLNQVIEIINSDAIYNEVMSVRNDEIHNQSKIDDMRYRFDDNVNEGLKIISEGYFISNETLYNNIRQVLYLGNMLRDAMQLIIDNINRSFFYKER